ncbi:hypothetical protein SAMN06272781_7606 [Streptomyces sp. 1222.2]|nr:hypothetical protein SAMN06272781_7606 [Streptomyces sp. 1222.2]
MGIDPLHLSRPVADRLAEIGALDYLYDGRFTPCDLLRQIAGLHEASFTRSAGKGQLRHPAPGALHRVRCP